VCGATCAPHKKEMKGQVALHQTHWPNGLSIKKKKRGEVAFQLTRGQVTCDPLKGQMAFQLKKIKKRDQVTCDPLKGQRAFQLKKKKRGAK
jgi:hypothetical protein